MGSPDSPLAGGLKWSTNILTMCGTPRGVNRVYIEGFNTGTTFGLGAATTMGPLILLAGPGPFNGTVGGLFGVIEQ